MINLNLFDCLSIPDTELQYLSSLWDSRPSWAYKTKNLKTVPCCPEDAQSFCGETCFVDKSVCHIVVALLIFC